MKKQTHSGSPIMGFTGKYSFLSNFHPCTIHDGLDLYPTAEHAYQSAKTNSRKEKERIKSAPTPGKAKKLGRGVTLIFGWDKIKVDMMWFVLSRKFDRLTNPDLVDKLLQTGNRELIEDNNWGDTFWGVSNGEGENHLGKLLMKVRQKLRG